MLLREATTADLPAIIEVQEAGAVAGLGHIFPQDLHPFPRDALRARWAREILDPEVDVYVAAREQHAVEGFAAVRGNTLLHFGTAIETWGTGLAAAVHSELVARLARAAQPIARLRVFEENRRARRFYEKVGWVPTPRLSRSSFAPYPVLIDYELTLTDGSPPCPASSRR